MNLCEGTGKKACTNGNTFLGVKVSFLSLCGSWKRGIHKKRKRSMYAFAAPKMGVTNCIVIAGGNGERCFLQEKVGWQTSSIKK